MYIDRFRVSLELGGLWRESHIAAGALMRMDVYSCLCSGIAPHQLKIDEGQEPYPEL